MKYKIIYFVFKALTDFLSEFVLLINIFYVRRWTSKFQISDVHQEISHLHYVYKITFQEISTHVVYNTL